MDEAGPLHVLKQIGATCSYEAAGMNSISALISSEDAINRAIEQQEVADVVLYCVKNWDDIKEKGLELRKEHMAKEREKRK